MVLTPGRVRVLRRTEQAALPSATTQASRTEGADGGLGQLRNGFGGKVRVKARLGKVQDRN